MAQVPASTVRPVPPLGVQARTSRRRARSPLLSRATSLFALVLSLLGLELSLPVATTAQAPTTSVAGRVVDALTGRPLEGARVWVSDADPVAWTDGDGRFRLDDVPVGIGFLRVAFLGTVASDTRVRLHANRELELQLRVPAVVLPLAPLRVTIARPVVGKLVGFHRRRERGLGQFITRAEIERRAPLETSDLFRLLPGVRVGPRATTSRTRMAVSRSLRPCPVAYFLDGMWVPGFHVDDVPPEDIDGIEIYRGPSQTPPAFRRRLTCAAVVIWTRDPAVPRPPS